MPPYPGRSINTILGLSTFSSSIIHQFSSRPCDTQSRHPTEQIKPSRPDKTASYIQLTIANPQSQVRLMHGIPRRWGGTCMGPNRRSNRRLKYACYRNYNQAVTLFCGVNTLGRLLHEEPSSPRCVISRFQGLRTAIQVTVSK